jgi:hypothetical protein
MKHWSNIFTKRKLTLLGVVLGTIGGFLYWKFIGCTSGTCPITSSPVLSTIWGGAMGGLLFNIFEKKTVKQ